MILIRELIEESKVIEEEENGKKALYIVGPCIQTDLINANKRRYRSDIMEDKVAHYQTTHIDKHRAYGELGHPNTPKINLERVSHMFVSLIKEGKNYIGKSKLIDTPYGNIASALAREGAGLGISTRCVGTMIESNGVTDIQPDLRICTAGDIVADPSGPDCFVTALMEDKEWVFVNGVWTEADASAAQNHMHNSKNIMQEQINVFENFLSGLQKYK
jgi:hypothetical protein